jgi:excisionase family DNA binding protein
MENISEPRNRAERRAVASAAHGGTKKYGWKVSEWATAIGCSRARVYQLISAGEIASVRFGASRIIRTHPETFLASLGDDAA